MRLKSKCSPLRAARCCYLTKMQYQDQSLPSSLSLPLNEHISHLPQATSSSIPPPQPPPPSPNATTHRPLTLRQLVMHHLDINAVPCRGFFRLLRHFTEDEREMERLDELGEANELGAVSFKSFPQYDTYCVSPLLSKPVLLESFSDQGICVAGRIDRTTCMITPPGPDVRSAK